MYFNTNNEEPPILDVISLDIQGITFEIQITNTFFSYESPVHAKKHNHAHFEVFLNKSCCGDMLIESGKLEFSAGSMIIIAPNVYHSYKPEPENLHSKYNFKFKFRTSEKTKALFEDFSFKHIEDARIIIDMTEKIHSIYYSDSFAAKQELSSLFTILLIHILRYMTLAQCSMENNNPALEYDKKINEIESFFESHYDSFPPPSNLAKHLSVSTRQLDRILKQLFAMSFSSKLALTKTELAKDLLASNDMTIAGISENLGYMSPASFSAAFKKITGYSPNTYRKNII